MRKRTNKFQKVLEYAVYMMVGSYFKKYSCFSSWLESSMYIEYKEVKKEKQIDIEELCINYAENVLLKKLPKEVWNQQVKVEFVRGLNDVSEIRFVGKSYVLKLFTRYKGEYTKFAYELIQK